jgi:exopolyphosphatase / guanosine-5'-triphosphate,3'-diphosphate pyrophosphatase
VTGPEVRRVAAVDCGTNSLRLLIADVDAARRVLADVDRRMEIVRLGQGVDATGRLAPDALARTFRVLEQYKRAITDSRAEAVRMVATSATRDAANADEFARGVTAILGVTPEVVSGQEEAFLSFTGATTELAGDGAGAADASSGPASGTTGLAAAADRLEPPYLVVDIGGGSTEFVLGDAVPASPPSGGDAALTDPRPSGSAAFVGPSPSGDAALSGPTARGDVLAGRPPSGDAVLVGPPSSGADVLTGRPPRGHPAGSGLDALSMDIGCVRLTERHLRSDPPTLAETAAAVADIDAALAAVAASIAVSSARTLVGLAGSVTTVAAIALDLQRYDPATVHHARISAARVHEVTYRLLGQTRAERAAIPVMHPGRVDVIGAGALILDRTMIRFGFAEMVASEHDILDGIAWSIAAGRP